MPDLTHKSIGAIANSSGAGSLSVPQPALVSGDYAVLFVFDDGRKTAPTTPPTGYTFAGVVDDSAGDGAWFTYYRRASSSIAATNVSVSFLDQGFAYIVVASGSSAGIGAPTMTTMNELSGVGYWQTPALTVTDRLVYSFAWILAARTQGTLSNQGTITSTNTSRAFGTSGSFRVQVVSSVVTSAAGGAVRATFTGGNAGSLTVGVILPKNPPPAPTGLTLTPGDHELGIAFTPSTGATQSKRRWRRTDLTPPSVTTQTSAPGHLARSNSLAGGTSYGYTYPGTGVRNYIVDTGIRYTHNEFTGRTAPGFSIGPTAYDDDSANHGTGTASVAVGTVIGVAKGATVISVNVVDDPDEIANQLGAVTLEACFDWILADLAANPAPAVINFSLGLEGMVGGGTDSPDVQTQLVRMLDAGIPIALAIGNSGVDVTSNLLEADPRLMFAGFSDPATDIRSAASNYGQQLTVFAPVFGMTRASSSTNSATAVGGASSEASPMLAGALVKIKQANPELGVAWVKEVIESQAWPLVTSVPVGPTRLLNINANTDQWSEGPVAASDSMDELDVGTYEIQVASEVGGVWSDWSASQTATTTNGVVTGTLAASTPTVTVDVPTASWAGTVTAPAFTGTLTANTPTVTVDVPAASWSGSTGAPSFTGTLVADTPLVSVAVPSSTWNGTSTVPQYAGSLTADTPSVTVAVPTLTWAGTTTVPVFTGLLDAVTPLVVVDVGTVAWWGTVAAPGAFVGTLDTTTPVVDVSVPAVSWSGSYLAQSGANLVTTTPTITIDVPTVAWAGTATVPTYAGTITATTPTLTIGTPDMAWTGGGTGPTYIGALTATLPTVTIHVPAWEQRNFELVYPPIPRDRTITNGPTRTITGGSTRTLRPGITLEENP